MFGIIGRLPGKVSVYIFYFYIISAYIVNFLISNIYGLLLVCVGLYIFSENLFLITPYTFNQLLDWYISLSSDYKIGIASSLITITGFLIAFHFATINWRQQMLAQHSMDVASEIEGIYTEAQRTITNLQIFSDLVIRSIETLNSDKNINEKLFSVSYVAKQTSAFLNARDKFSKILMEAHRILGKHYGLLTAARSSHINLRKVNEKLDEISKNMWVQLPHVDMNDINVLDSFKNQINLKSYQNLSNVCSTHFDYISATSGAIRGLLLAPITGFNFSMLVELIKERKSFGEVFIFISKDKK